MKKQIECHPEFQSKYILKNKLANQDYGKQHIYVCQNITDGHEYVAKLIQKNTTASSHEIGILEKIANEAQDAPFLILIERLTSISSEYDIIITEKYSMDLMDYMMQKGRLHESEAIMIFKKLCNAVKILHTWNILHNDIKPENVFLKLGHDSAVEVHLGDFGSICSIGKLIDTDVGVTLRYVPPEFHRGVFRQEKVYYKPSHDIFSLGIILFCMLTNEFPFSDLDGSQRFKELHDLIFTDKITMKYKYLSRESISFLRKLLHLDADQRFSSVDQILEHSWIRADTKTLKKRNFH